MPYIPGTIVWYQKTVADPDIAYTATDPCAATVTTVHSPELADLTIMVDNDTPVMRLAVPLVDKNTIPASGHFAMADRSYWA